MYGNTSVPYGKSLTNLPYLGVFTRSGVSGAQGLGWSLANDLEVAGPHVQRGCPVAQSDQMAE